MYSDISVQIVSLIYVLILSMVYFFKRKYNFIESKVYKILLIFTMITLVLDIFTMYVIDKMLYMSLLPTFLSRLYFLSLLIWLILFMSFVLLNVNVNKYDNFSSLIKKSSVSKLWIFASFFIIILSM